ncbi:hypothetical protein E3N86_12390 [Cryobacterium sp. Hz7]|uniref:hypothetical protein n=1 Tax=Cryobacterium sp. Hz7 TaxID=1259166 RepID=UPI00106A534A|nr:hypothetical protein [Cryobacterium sp. Hz7]TFB59034.1 hypothetical protein E3N86_12390 [Cryobacterium sp. Hz7]
MSVPAEQPIAIAPLNTAPEQASDAAPLTAYGNHPASFGVPIDFEDSVAVVDGAVFDPPCTEDSSRAPENGHFLVLSTTVDLGQHDGVNALNSFGFKWIGSDGATMSAGLYTNAARFCFPLGEILPAAMGPGQHGSGKIVLDVNSTSGTLMWLPDATQPGYEWAIASAQ